MKITCTYHPLTRFDEKGKEDLYDLDVKVKNVALAGGSIAKKLGNDPTEYYVCDTQGGCQDQPTDFYCTYACK